MNLQKKFLKIPKVIATIFILIDSFSVTAVIIGYCGLLATSECVLFL
jgi:hypothetical protein